MANTIAINVLAETRKAVAGLRDVNSNLGLLRKTARSVGPTLKGILGAQVVTAGLGALKKGFTDVVEAGSKLQQSTGAIDAVFGDQAAKMKQYGQEAAGSLGLSKNSYQELATVLGAGLKNNGIEDFAGSTTKVIGLGADLAAQFGGSTKDAVEAIGSLMRGEADPIERYGVSIKQSAISAELAANGQDKLTGAAKTQAEATARLKLLFEQTTSAQGAFARESNTLAGAQQRNQAAMENLRATIGTALLPVLTSLAVWFSNFLPKAIAFGQGIYQQMLPAIRQFGGYLKTEGVPALKAFAEFVVTRVLPVIKQFAGFLRENIPPAVAALSTAFGVLKTVLGVIVPLALKIITFFGQNLGLIRDVAAVVLVLVGAYKLLVLQQKIVAAGGFLKFLSGVITSTKLWTAAQRVLNVVLRANPIGLVITAIALLVAGVILAYRNSETFRKIVTAAWNAIKKVGSSVFGFLKTFIPAVFKGVVSLVKGYVNLQLTIIRTAWNAIKAVTSAVWTAIKFLIVNPIKSAVSIGKSAFESLRSAISSKIAAIKAKVSEIKTSIVNTFNGLGDRMRSIGVSIIQGLINGMKSMISNAVGIVADLANRLKDSITKKLGIKSPSRVFMGYGKNIGQGLAIGIDQTAKSVNKSMVGLAMGMNGAFKPEFDINGLNNTSRGGGGTTFAPVINVTPTPLATPEDTGRAVYDALEAMFIQKGKTLRI